MRTYGVNQGFHFTHIWSRSGISLFAINMEKLRDFDLLKAFDYIERVMKFDFIFGKTLFTLYVRNVK